MNSKRLYFGLIGIIFLLCIGLVAGAYGINKLLTTKSNELTSLKAQSQALNQEQLSLVKANADIKKYGDLEKIAKSIVPQDKNQAEAVREIANIADANGISLGAINFPSSTLGTTGPAAAGATSGSSSSSQSASSAAPATQPAAPSAAGSLSQLMAVKNIPGVYQLTISVQSDSTSPVSYSKIISFLNALEHNRRTAQVTTINLQPSTTQAGLLTFNLTLNEYIKP